MKLSIFIMVVVMVLSGCASSTPSITIGEMHNMNLAQFLKKAGYEYKSTIKVYQKREKSSGLRGEDGKQRPDIYCLAKGGNMVRMKDMLNFPEKVYYYPFNKKIGNVFKEKVEWFKNPKKYDLYINSSNLKIVSFGQYCIVNEKPIFLYYKQPFIYLDGYTDIVVETSQNKLNNLKKILYNEPLNQCLSYLNIANSITEQWDRNIKEKKKLLDKKEIIQKRENKYSKELANAVLLTPQTFKHIPLVSERLFNAIAKDFKEMQVVKIKAKFYLEEQNINREYAMARKPIQDQINQIDISFSDLESKFKKLNAQYLMSLGIVPIPFKNLYISNNIAKALNHISGYEIFKKDPDTENIIIDINSFNKFVQKLKTTNQKGIQNRVSVSSAKIINYVTGYEIFKKDPDTENIIIDINSFNEFVQKNDIQKNKNAVNTYNVEEGYLAIKQVCSSFAEKKQKIIEGE